MLLLNSAGKPIDFVTVLDAVNNAEIFSAPEDAKVYLYSIAESVPALSNTLTYAQIVHDRYISRTLIGACKEVIESAADASTPPNELLDLAEQKIYETIEIHQK